MDAEKIQMEIEAAKAAEAKKTEVANFLALEPLPKRKAAPPPPPGVTPPPEKEEKRSKKSQIIHKGNVPPLPVGIIPARPKDGQLPKPEQPKPDRALNLVLALNTAPVPEAKRVGVIKPMEVDTDGVMKLSGAAASSSGHVKGDGMGGSKTGHWSNMEDKQVEGSDTVPMLSIKDESESRKARIKALAEAVIACADSSREEVEKALERLALIKIRRRRRLRRAWALARSRAPAVAAPR